MILPMVTRSALMLYSSDAPPKASRNPVMTSSRMSTVPSRSVMARRACRYPGLGGTQPMLPTTGSTMTQAIWPLYLAKASSHRLEVVVGQRQGELHELFRHSRRAGNSQRRHARAGLHQQGVAVPVIAALELHDVLAIGVSTRETDGRHRRFRPGADEAHFFDHRKRFDNQSARSASVGVEAPKLVPLRAAWTMASITSGTEWPRMSGPQDPT